MQCGGNLLQIVFSEANWRSGKVRYSDGFGISCQMRCAEYRCGRHRYARLDHHIPAGARIERGQHLADALGKRILAEEEERDIRTELQAERHQFCA